MVVDEHGHSGTLLHVAAEYQHDELCEFLISHGADPYMTVERSALCRKFPAGWLWYSDTVIKEVAAIELVNPLRLPGPLGPWDEPSPCHVSFAIFITRLLEDPVFKLADSPEAPKLLLSAIHKFLDMDGPNLPPQTHALSAIWSAFQKCPTILSNISSHTGILRDVLAIDGTAKPEDLLGCIVANADVSILLWPDRPKEPPDKQIFDITRACLRMDAKSAAHTLSSCLDSWELGIVGVTYYSSRTLFKHLCCHVKPESQDRNGRNVFHHCLIGFNIIYSGRYEGQSYGNRFPADHDNELRWRLRYLTSLKFDINHKNRRGHTALHECALDTHYHKRISDRGRATRLAILAGVDPMVLDNDSMLPIELATLAGTLVIVVELLVPRSYGRKALLRFA
ncbi:hypothetical protein K440DRAFT_644046 [Wilcoxina mikolae CBS 423.85]|nr:hypothetical protein K440DRAFT_644046 [Wilcoxina mikolae CBS 423.85]